MKPVTVRRRRKVRRVGRSSPRGLRARERAVGPWPARDAAYFDLLKKFVRREEHARVPYYHREGHFPLGAWVGRQRRGFRRGRLSVEQIRLLEAFPGWTWSPRDEDFRKGLRALEAFVRREGHARVPHAHREDGTKLGSWVAVRRRDYARGRLDSERVRSIEAVPGWFWRREDPFLASSERLRRYVEREGHARVPPRHREDRLLLGRWVEHARRAYRSGRLRRDRARLLESLPGWTWRPEEERFERGLRLLRRFQRREGHGLVARGHVEEGFLLGVWVGNRRADYRKGRLSPQQARRLEALPGWSWSSRGDSFEEAFSHLLRFVKREGHASVPVDQVERGFRLGAWVHKRRGERDRMGEERRRRLEALPGWVWNKFDAQFQEGLRSLRVFAKWEGHARVPALHVEAGFPLGRWVSHLRARKDGLGLERRKALEAIRGWSWRLRPPRV